MQWLGDVRGELGHVGFFHAAEVVPVDLADDELAEADLAPEEQSRLVHSGREAGGGLGEDEADVAGVGGGPEASREEALPQHRNIPDTISGGKAALDVMLQSLAGLAAALASERDLHRSFLSHSGPIRGLSVPWSPPTILEWFSFSYKDGGNHRTHAAGTKPVTGRREGTQSCR